MPNIYKNGSKKLEICKNMQIYTNHSLKKYNTFGIDAKAKYFVECQEVEDLKNLFTTPVVKNNPVFILGGGSNVLFTKDFDGIIIKIGLKGIKTYMEDNHHFFVKAGAGVIWHDFVNYCTDRDYGGIENLALIPGTVGAAPIQNIGAYGVELKDIFYQLKALDIESGEIRTFKKEDCQFGYRDSIFKRSLKGKCIILEVTFKLNKNHQCNTSYGAIENELKAQSLSPSIKNIKDVVIKIRQSKLPDPSVIGNAGSFFKNPSIELKIFEKIKKKFKDIVSYAVDENHVKIAAGWLIESCGWKGYKEVEFGVYEKQALVLVNHGKAKGHDIYDLSEKIILSVKEKFGIILEREVNII
jgi:UDP-N-acetylmuramate dehydrogenase